MIEKELVQEKTVKVEGPVSKHLNRRLSMPLAHLLHHKYWITPNMVSWFSLLLAVLAALMYMFGRLVMPARITIIDLLILMPSVAIGGILTQLSSVVDGVDGDLARLRNATSDSGGVLDAILDRYADIAILLGLTFAVRLEGNAASLLPFAVLQVPMSEELLIILFVLALSGSLMVSYSRARLEHAGLFHPDGRTFLGATRDVRLFLIFICSLLSCPLLALIIIAFSGNLTVAERLRTMIQS